VLLVSDVVTLSFLLRVTSRHINSILLIALWGFMSRTYLQI